jgi:HTH-type transcriptional regulator, global nitrogen regulator NrpRI
MGKKELNQNAILTAMNKLKTPTGTHRLTEFLAAAGVTLSERTVRIYLNELEEAGLIESQGKRKRVITKLGLNELSASQTFQRVGWLSSKIDQMTFDMTFDLVTRTGMVVVNTSILNAADLDICMPYVLKVFECGYSMGDLVTILGPGESLGELTIPEGKIGFCSVCSITLNGVLLKHGVPTNSKFGGLVELRDNKPIRFAEMIHYDATTIDPLEVFIRAAMTDYVGAVSTGNGLIGASFREMPENSRELAVRLAERLEAIGLGGFMKIGWPGQPVLGIPVNQGCIGVVIIGGLNPIAVLVEKGYQFFSRALAGLLEYNRLFHYSELPEAVNAYL